LQARHHEALVLPHPFHEHTLRPLAARLSGGVARVTSASFADRTAKRLALAGNPGDLRVADWLGVKAISAFIFAAIFFFLFVILDAFGAGFVFNLVLVVVGLFFGYTAPECWLGG